MLYSTALIHFPTEKSYFQICSFLPTLSEEQPGRSGSNFHWEITRKNLKDYLYL